MKKLICEHCGKELEFPANMTDKDVDQGQIHHMKCVMEATKHLRENKEKGVDASDN